MIDHFSTNQPRRIIDSGIFVTGFSDHDLIFGVRKTVRKAKKEPKIIKCRQLNKYNPDSFKKDLSKVDWEAILALNNIDAAIEQFQSQFTLILDQHAPVKQRKVRNKYAPYISSELRQQMFRRDTIKKRFRRTKDLKDWEKFVQLRNKVNIDKTKAKKSYYNQKFQNSKNDIKETWRTINTALGRNSKTTSIQQLEIDKIKITEPKTICEELNKYFCDIPCKLQKGLISHAAVGNNQLTSVTFESYIAKIPKGNENFKFRQLTASDVVKSIMKRKTSRSGNVPTKFLKDAVDFVSPILACIFNKSVEKGYFPSILKTAIVSPIYKGEGSRSDPSNYRPISVLPIIARVFERLIHQQLYPYLNKFLWKNQSGFRSHYSTETALLKATNNWLLNIDKGNYNLALFLDLKKAFDTVDHNTLLRKLEYYGIIHKELNWLTSYLSDRLQCCKIDGQISSKLKVRLSIPQGSCLGPLLFLVYINDLPQCLANSEPDIYADDTSLTNNEKDLVALENKVNRDLSNIEKWLYANKLQLNTVKTKYMIIATPHRLKRKQKLCIKIGSKEIEAVEVKSYLGVTVDNRLKWDEHIH